MANGLEALLGLQRQGGGGANALELSSLRQARRRELQPRVAAGDPRAAATLGQLEQDIAGDPDTGVAEAARVAGIRGQLDEAAMFNRPEIAEVRQQKESDALRRLLLPVQAKAQYEAEQNDAEFARQLFRDRLQHENILSRQQQAQRAMAERAELTRQGQSERVAQADRYRQAAALEKQLAEMGWFDRLRGKAAELESRIAQLRGGVSEVEQIAAVLGAQGIDPRAYQQQLMAEGAPEDEIAAMEEVIALMEGMQ